MMGGIGAGLGMGLMGVIPLLVIALVVWLVLEAIRNREQPPTPPASRPSPASRQDPPPPNRAFAILAERYARGELTREEFLERRRDLQELA